LSITNVDAFPNIIKIKSNHDYLLIENRNLPIIDLRITFDSGSVNDGDNEGILSFSVNLLHQQLLNNKKIISYFEEIGAQYNSSVSKEKSYISLRFVSTTDNIYLISETINEMLSLNGISDELISENKVKVLNIINRTDLDPGRLAQKKTDEIFFNGSPLSHPTIGYSNKIERLDKNLIRQKLIRLISKSKISVSLVGDINENTSAFLISNMLGNIKRETQKIELPLKYNKLRKSTENIFFDSTQTHINIYIPSINRHHKDFYNILVANHILGGSGFGSRLMEEIREKKGFAYSVYSYLSIYNDFGILKINLQTDNKNVNEALNIISVELNKFKNFDATEDEVSLSKQSLIRNVLTRMDTNSSMLQTLASINDYDLQDDYYKNYVSGIQNVNLKSIKKAILDNIKFENALIVTLGGR
tara:strand:+ start:1398 stop:2648 length:1251 start_codon:yes stop_codon:yes gene_type:complete